MSNNQVLSVLHSDMVKQRFAEMLGKDAPIFISSIISAVNANPKLKECNANSILTAAGIAASLKLPINPNLGYAYMVPYKGAAQFQMGWKGYVQLAMRSGQYATLNANVVYEGQIKEIDFITGDIIRGEKISDKIVGYVAYMELTNGFHKTLYMTLDEIKNHAMTYSQSYAFDKKNGRKSSIWSTNFDAMAKKTVLKRLLSQFGVMSIEMTQAVRAEAGETIETEYITDTPVETIDPFDVPPPNGENDESPQEDESLQFRQVNSVKDDTPVDEEG